MARKRLGHGTVLKLDSTALGLIRSITPPAKTREAVDTTVMSDTIMEYMDSDPPDQGELKFVLGWEPGDANSELLDTLFDNSNPSAREGTFVIEYPFRTPPATTPDVTDTFTGFITALTPAQIVSKELITREVTVRLTSKPTRS